MLFLIVFFRDASVACQVEDYSFMRFLTVAAKAALTAGVGPGFCGFGKGAFATFLVFGLGEADTGPGLGTDGFCTGTDDGAAGA